MIKNLYYGAALLAMLAILATFAEAKHHHKKHHASGQEYSQIYKKGKHKMMNFQEVKEDKMEKIMEEYDDVMEDINDEKLTTEQKSVLERQAGEARALAEKQLQERLDMMKAHFEEIKAISGTADNMGDIKDIEDDMHEMFH